VPDAVVVTAIGMRTAVGNDAVQSAAAVRAGVNRFALWERLGTAFEDEAGVIASALPDDFDDEPWVQKAIDMVPEPIHEALWSGGLYDFSEARGGGSGSPSPSRRAFPSGRTAPHLAAYIATPYADRAGVSNDAFRLFSIEAREHCIAPARADSVQIVSCDHAAGIVALERASRDLQEGKVDFAVVGALDSLLHAEYLRVLWGEGRLKLPSRADGLIPGEAAAVVVLERQRDAEARQAPILGRLGAAAVDHEAVPLGPEHPIRAEGASRAIAAALERNGGAERIERIVVDLTGERWRSLEWALVETRCLGRMPRGWQLWHPADCLGDVGAATSIVHLGLALRAFARGYGGAGGILIAAASARGERAAVPVFPIAPPQSSSSPRKEVA
jgi:3-oxoacyl-[acyl-carrier-protein] synthase-1